MWLWHANQCSNMEKKTTNLYMYGGRRHNNVGYVNLALLELTTQSQVKVQRLCVFFLNFKLHFYKIVQKKIQKMSKEKLWKIKFTSIFQNLLVIWSLLAKGMNQIHRRGMKMQFLHYIWLLFIMFYWRLQITNGVLEVEIKLISHIPTCMNIVWKNWFSMYKWGLKFCQ